MTMMTMTMTDAKAFRAMPVEALPSVEIAGPYADDYEGSSAAWDMLTEYIRTGWASEPMRLMCSRWSEPRCIRQGRAKA